MQFLLLGIHRLVDTFCYPVVGDFRAAHACLVLATDLKDTDWRKGGIATRVIRERICILLYLIRFFRQRSVKRCFGVCVDIIDLLFHTL